MLGALYIGLSGMNAYAQGLTNISNNVSNLNTPGFKATHASFSELARSLGGGDRLGARENSGSGVLLDAMNTDFTQGELRSTSGELDLAVDGAGFLVLLKDGTQFFTRTGQFRIDEDGYIALGDTGMRLATLDATGQPAPASVEAKKFDPPVASTKITLSENISSTGAEAIVSGISIYDALGVKSTWQIRFTPVGAGSPGEWNAKITNANGVEIATTRIKFSGGSIDPSSSVVTITDSTDPAAPRDIALDFTSVTSFSTGSSSTIRASAVDGSAFGTLSTVTVDENGAIKLTYDNAKTASLGAIALADFRSPELLGSRGSGIYEASAGDPPRLTPTHTGVAGKVQGKMSEASNVNLSQEFGDLILIQRGFQASSQVVSVTNEMMQQLFGLRGNG